MTTYTSITNGQVDSGSPIDEALMTALRDNPLAIVEGNATGSGIYVEKASLATDIGTWDIIETLTIAASGHGANVLFDHADNANYNQLMIKGYCSVELGGDFYLQTGNSSTYDTSGYSYMCQGVYETSTRLDWQSSSASSVLLCEDSTSNGAGTAEVITFSIIISGASDTAPTSFDFSTTMTAGAGDMNLTSGTGCREENAAHDIFRLVVSSGEWRSGEFKIFGLLNS